MIFSFFFNLKIAWILCEFIPNDPPPFLDLSPNDHIFCKKIVTDSSLIWCFGKHTPVTFIGPRCEHPGGGLNFQWKGLHYLMRFVKLYAPGVCYQPLCARWWWLRGKRQMRQRVKVGDWIVPDKLHVPSSPHRMLRMQKKLGIPWAFVLFISGNPDWGVRRHLHCESLHFWSPCGYFLEIWVETRFFVKESWKSKA